MAVFMDKKPQQVTDVTTERGKNRIFQMIDIHFPLLPIRKGQVFRFYSCLNLARRSECVQNRYFRHIQNLNIWLGRHRGL